MVTRLIENISKRVKGEMHGRLVRGLEPAAQGDCQGELGAKC